MNLESNEHIHKKKKKKKKNSSSVFWARLASFYQLGLISDPYINFQKSRNELSDNKGPEHINYTI